MKRPGWIPGFPRWSHLRYLNVRFSRFAVLILILVPIAAEGLGWFGVPYQHFRYPLYGALSYLFGSLIFAVACPRVVKLHHDEMRYQEYCLAHKTTLDFYDEFAVVTSLTPEAAATLFGAKDFLFPLHKGLQRAKDESIGVYASIAYGQYDASRLPVRWLTGLTFALSIPMMEYLMIQRLIHVLGGMSR